MSIKQVWEIIKDHQCAELQMVQNPALAVWNHQQAIIDQLTEEFEEDKRFLKEAIQSKDTQIEKYKYIQKSDEMLIASQKKRVDQLKAEKVGLESQLNQANQLIKMQECGVSEIIETAEKGIRKSGGNYYLEKIIELLKPNKTLRGEHE